MTDTTLATTLEPRDLVDWLLSRGRHWVTTAEAAELLSIPAHHVAPSLAEMRRRGHLFSPTKGLYVAIPPEFRSWGTVPAAHFVDPMMRHLGHDYYVCLLSAAEVHGYSHQRPQVFQVMTSGRLRDRAFGRVRIEFITSRHTPERPTTEVNTPTGTMVVATREVTILDLVSFPSESGSLDNVSTILGDMVQDQAIDMTRLAEIAVGYPVSIAQRTGWLLDSLAIRLDAEVDTEPLRQVAAARTTPTPLDPAFGRLGTLDPRWNVLFVDLPDDESL